MTTFLHKWLQEHQQMHTQKKNKHVDVAIWGKNAQQTYTEEQAYICSYWVRTLSLRQACDQEIQEC